MIIKNLMNFIWKNKINQYFNDNYLSKQNVIFNVFRNWKIKQINVTFISKTFSFVTFETVN